MPSTSRHVAITDPGRLRQLLDQARDHFANGRFVAARRIGRILASASPDDVNVLALRAALLHVQGRFDAAEALWRKAVSIRPDAADLAKNLGVTLLSQGRFGEALDVLNRAAEIDPDSADIQYVRGSALLSLRRYEEASAVLGRAVSLNPRFPDALNQRGNALRKLGRTAEATGSYRHATELQPGNAGLWNNLGAALEVQGNHAEALRCYEHAVGLKQDYAEAWNNRGNCLRALSRDDEALASYGRALACRPDFADALNNRGVTLFFLGRHAEALADFDRALELRPSYPDAWSNRGAALRSFNRNAEALQCFDHALQLQPGFTEALFNKGITLLRTGHWEEGWALYELRWKIDAPGQRDFKWPLWLGEASLSGKSILLYGEQGFGDSLQFCRYAQRTSELADKVFLEVPSGLVELMRSLRGPVDVLPRGAPLPKVDFQTPLASLPLAFRTTIGSVPSETPYLRAPADRIAAWRSRLPRTTRPLVGVAWAGRDKPDPGRTIPFRTFMKVLDGRASFISLMKEVPAGELRDVDATGSLVHFGSDLGDFADTAALVHCCDLVISIDTSVAHLAGAMGKAVWVLLPFGADWRWLLDRDDSPWYPTARLFRQPEPGDWVSVVSKAGTELAHALDSSAFDVSARTHGAGQMVRGADECRRLRREAVRLFESRDYAGARKLCAQLTASCPDDFVALNLSASLLAQDGSFRAAIPLYERALSQRPGSTEVARNLAIALMGVGMEHLAKGEPAIALEHFDRGIGLAPRQPELLLRRGVALGLLDRHAEALQTLDDVLTLIPLHRDALRNRGIALLALHRDEEARACLERTLALEPDDPELRYRLGNALQRLECHADAIAQYERALALRSDFPEALVKRGNSLLHLKQHADALASFERAIALRPGYHDAISNRAVALSNLGRDEDALACYERELPGLAQDRDALANRANLLLRLSRYQDALDAYEQVLEMRPDSAAFVDHGLALTALGRHDEAIVSYDRALALRPGYVDALWNKGLALLRAGRWQEGWILYESRWDLDGFARREFSCGKWIGDESLRGRTILLHSEQGFGDTLQFCRYVPMVRALGAEVILQVPDGLVELMQSLDGSVRVLAQGAELPPCDLHTPLASLPLAFHTSIENIPARVPYLRTPAERVAAWSARLKRIKRPLVGIAWAGSPKHTNDRNRSLPFEQLLPLFDRSIRFASLQKEVRPSDEAVLGQRPDVLRFERALRDFTETAALIARCELVISADTSVAHLAGALGRPVWILLPFAADWRWLLDREDSPWYPTARLFRQSASGDWAGVVERVRTALMDHLGTRRTAAPVAIPPKRRGVVKKRAGPTGARAAKPRRAPSN